MLIIKLALKNILGAGLRTWLNVIALSFSFVAIIYMQGLYNGMSDQMEKIAIEAEYAGGQYWHSSYDPFDPLTLDDAHGKIPDNLHTLIDRGEAIPILIRAASIYPNGRFQNALLKGIPPDQKILSIPSGVLENGDTSIPALIGGRMARSTGLKKGDYLTVRWRDTNGTFDADEFFISNIMKTDDSAIDNGQLWIPLEKMREMMDMKGEATIVVLKSGSRFAENAGGWNHKNLEFLMKDIRALFLTKSIGGSIFYMILLLLAMLALFDTQILSIFRRRKEMGTLMALGMTRGTLIRLFTLEGAIHSVLAAVVAAVYGIPLLAYSARTGFGLPESTDDFGLAIGNRIFPSFTGVLVAGSILLVLTVTTIVSYLPARKIAKLEPTDALRGKMT